MREKLEELIGMNANESSNEDLIVCLELLENYIDIVQTVIFARRVKVMKTLLDSKKLGIQ